MDLAKTQDTRDDEGTRSRENQNCAREIYAMKNAYLYVALHIAGQGLGKNCPKICKCQTSIEQLSCNAI